MKLPPTVRVLLLATAAGLFGVPARAADPWIVYCACERPRRWVQ